MKIISFFSIILFSALFSFAQADLPIMGEVSQVKGMVKVYIAGATSDERKIILAAFKKEQKKIPFVVVGDPAEAEFFMNFGELTRQAVGTFGGAAYQERDELEVYFYNKDKRKSLFLLTRRRWIVLAGVSIFPFLIPLI